MTRKLRKLRNELAGRPPHKPAAKASIETSAKAAAGTANTSNQNLRERCGGREGRVVPAVFQPKSPGLCCVGFLRDLVFQRSLIGGQTMTISLRRKCSTKASAAANPNKTRTLVGRSTKLL